MKTFALSLCLFTVVACGRPPEDELAGVDDTTATSTDALTAEQIATCRSAYKRAVAAADRDLVHMVVNRCLALDDGPNGPSVEQCRSAYNRAVAIGDRDLVNMVLRRCSQ